MSNDGKLGIFADDKLMFSRINLAERVGVRLKESGNPCIRVKLNPLGIGQLFFK
jgi:hypothetical protein